MEFNKKMLKINRLEQNFASINHKIDKKYNRIICNFDSYCYFPATYKLITRRPDFHYHMKTYIETEMCENCAKYVNTLSDYQLDSINYVCISEL